MNSTLLTSLQGVNTLWGSFEVKNTKLVKKMLQQYYGKPLYTVSSLSKLMSANYGITRAVPFLRLLPPCSREVQA